MKTNHIRFAVPPGQYLLEELSAQNISFKNLKALVAGLTTEQDLLSGAIVVNEDMAAQIGRALGMPAKIWLDLEDGYRKALETGRPLLDDHALDAAQAKAASGKLLLRLPLGLHRRATEAAKAEGISLNQLLLSYIAEGIGRTEGGRPAR